MHATPRHLLRQFVVRPFWSVAGLVVFVAGIALFPLLHQLHHHHSHHHDKIGQYATLPDGSKVWFVYGPPPAHHHHHGHHHEAHEPHSHHDHHHGPNDDQTDDALHATEHDHAEGHEDHDHDHDSSHAHEHHEHKSAVFVQFAQEDAPGSSQELAKTRSNQTQESDPTHDLTHGEGSLAHFASGLATSSQLSLLPVISGVFVKIPHYKNQCKREPYALQNIRPRAPPASMHA